MEVEGTWKEPGKVKERMGNWKQTGPPDGSTRTAEAWQQVSLEDGYGPWQTLSAGKCVQQAMDGKDGSGEWLERIGRGWFQWFVCGMMFWWNVLMFLVRRNGVWGFSGWFDRQRWHGFKRVRRTLHPSSPKFFVRLVTVLALSSWVIVILGCLPTKSTKVVKCCVKQGAWYWLCRVACQRTKIEGMHSTWWCVLLINSYERKARCMVESCWETPLHFQGSLVCRTWPRWFQMAWWTLCWSPRSNRTWSGWSKSCWFCAQTCQLFWQGA